MLKIYGTAMSRAARVLWAAEEVGVKYEHIPISFQGDPQKPEYLKINPNGHIPAIDDNGFIVWESMAINLYLSEKYGKAPLWPSTIEGRAGAYQWSFWGMTEVEPHLLTILRNRMMLPAEQRDENAAKQAVEALNKPMKVLDDHLKGREYILGKDFTIADLNVASVASLSKFIGLTFSSTPTAQKWLDKCLGREANQRTRGMK